MAATLAEAIRDERVPLTELHERYDPVLQMVRVLLGVVPNCDTYLEVWPVGFRSYNLMVPNFLNLPASLVGRAAPMDDRTAAIVAAALAMSPSPSVVDASTISTVTSTLSAAEIVEVAVWMAISQLQHRLSLWYGLAN